MANNSPTVVIGKLNDEELKTSIDKLVKHVDDALQTMQQHTTAAVKNMETTLKGLGNIKIDSGGAADGGYSRRTKAQQQENKAVQETTASYDQLAQAQQKASGRKKGIEYMTLSSDVDKELTYLVNVNKDVDAQMDAILKKEQELILAKQKEAQASREIAEEQARISQASGIYSPQNTTDQSLRERQSRAALSQSVNENFASYDNLQSAIAKVIGVQQKEVLLADTEKDSYNNLTSTLKQLQTAYNNLTSAERESENGKAIAASIQEVQRAIQKIQQQASRPTSLKNVLGLDEKNLDDIAYKIRMLNAYRGGLNITNPKDKQEINEVNIALERLKKTQNEIMGQNKDLLASNNALVRSFNYMKNRLAFYFTVGASTQFVKQLIDIRGQYELLERSIGILIDSAQKGSQIFSELNAMAIKSPFTTMELGAAAKQLVAYDVAAKDVVDTTRRLADMAAAVGIPIERLTYALGQIKAYGYLNARDARMFANAGIPLVKELAERYTELEGRLVSTSDVYDRIKKKAISYEDVMETVNKMTDEGGKFFNFQEKAADTLKVKIANLTLAWNNMLNEMGKSNQGVLSDALSITKSMFDNWRNINNALTSVLITYGSIKAAQIMLLMLQKQYFNRAVAFAVLEQAFSAKFALNVKSIASSFMNFVGSPLKMASVGVAALTFYLVKALLAYNELKEANEEFNKSIADNAKENIESIDKFFSDYKKQLESISAASPIDQNKMWERLQEEIEKSTKNAKQYLETLNRISDTVERIKAGEAVLEQSQIIEKEAKRLAELGTFNLGGGYMDDALAENLIKTGNLANKLTKEFGNLSEAERKIGNAAYRSDWKTYQSSVEEVNKELERFTKTLDNADISAIMGDNPATQLANIREFAEIIRDNFLATEKGQKITSEGQARLNRYLDVWIAKQAAANDIIEGQNRIAIERNRTAWEDFFDQLNRNDKKRLNYLIQTNQTGSDEFKEIWDKAAKSMEERATTSYNFIRDQIAQLRNTPDIVINVVYKERTEKEVDKQREAFKQRYLTPDSSYTKEGIVTADAYFAEEKRLTEKYGRFIKKQGENNVEWEKRLGQEYQENVQNIQTLGKHLDNLNKKKQKGIEVSEVDIQAKKEEKKALEEANKALLDIQDSEGFDYSQFKKGGSKASKKEQINDEKEVAEALKQELSIIKEMQSSYDKLRKAGVDNTTAVDLAAQGYEDTLRRVNAVLQKYGISKFNAKDFLGKDVNSVLRTLEKQRNDALASGKLKTSALKELDVEIKKLNVDAKTYNMDKITKGLNNELDKLKEDYELAVELDASPEFGNMFANMFDIDPSELTHNINEYMFKVQDIFRKSTQEMGYTGWTLDVFKANEKAWKDWGTNVGLSDEQIEQFKSKFVDAQNYVKKWEKDVYTQTSQLQYKLADNNGKIAIEEEKLATLRIRLANETNNEQKRLLELQVQDQQNAINKLKEDILQMLPTYQRLFGEVAEHSAHMTRKLAVNYKQMLTEALARGQNADGTYTVTDPISGQQASLTKERLGKEIKNADKELQKTQSSIKKITEAFKKGDDGVVDWAHGVELVGDEFKKLGSLTNVVKDIAGLFTNPNEYNETAEIIGDIAQTFDGIGTAAQGIGQIASGDYIGGAVSLLSGVTSAISGWLDNDDKKISAEIKESERAVKRLEIAYKGLEDAVNNAYGASVSGAKRAALANKELQLVEIKRQIQLEKSRDSKDRDEDRILDLQAQYRDLLLEIKNGVADIVNEMLGISSVGDGITSIVEAMINAFRNGENAMDAFSKKWDEMIDSMILKLIVSEYMQKAWDKVMTTLKQKEEEFLKKSSEDKAAIQAELDYYGSMDEREAIFTYIRDNIEAGGYLTKMMRMYPETFEKYKHLYYDYIDGLNDKMQDVENVTDIASEDYLKWSLDYMMGEGKEYMTKFGQNLADALGNWYTFGQDSDKTLSALQQGIQGITEDTAGALEAYMNGVSQQVYLQSDILIEIRDIIQSYDLDVQLGVLSQILLQLQQSYQIQMSINNKMENWSNPSGQAVRVELIS